MRPEENPLNTNNTNKRISRIIDWCRKNILFVSFAEFVQFVVIVYFFMFINLIIDMV